METVVDNETAAQMARRLASIMRWASIFNYMIMYPGANVRASDPFASDIPDDLLNKEVMDWIAKRIGMHAYSLGELVAGLPDTKDGE